jgi:hypothetical protein
MIERSGCNQCKDGNIYEVQWLLETHDTMCKKVQEGFTPSTFAAFIDEFVEFLDQTFSVGRQE